MLLCTTLKKNSTRRTYSKSTASFLLFLLYSIQAVAGDFTAERAVMCVQPSVKVRARARNPSDRRAEDGESVPSAALGLSSA